MSEYSAAAVTTMKQQIAYAAITRTMNDQQWQGSAQSGFRNVNVRGTYPPVGGPTGEITLRTVYTGPDNPSTEFKVNPWEEVYKPWLDKIDAAFLYFDQFPDPATFDAKLAAAQQAVYRLTLANGDKEQGGSAVGDATTSTSVAFVGKWIAPGTPGAVDSATVRAFDQYYGAARMELVLAGQRDLAIVLGLALTGEKQLWTRARTDLMTLMDSAKQAFEDGGGGLSLDVFLSLVGLAAAFATGGAATALGVIAAAGGFVQSVLPPENGSKVDSPMDGNTADAVYDTMVEALKTLTRGTCEIEQDLLTMLTKTSARAGSYHDSYHINPDAGLAPSVADGKPIDIHGDLDIYRQVGYEMMPNIAGEMGRSAASAATCRDSLMWYRPAVFGVGSEGAFQAWSDLYDIASSVILSSAHEIVLAGQKLAQAAGYLHDADGTSSKALEGVATEIDRASVGWDVTDSTPPDYIRLPNGKVIGN